jgi:hypothetical protein
VQQIRYFDKEIKTPITNRISNKNTNKSNHTGSAGGANTSRSVRSKVEIEKIMKSALSENVVEH